MCGRSPKIKKYQSNTCGYSVINPPRLPEGLFEEVHFVPDPVLEADVAVYKDFHEVYSMITTNEGRPSLLDAGPISEQDKEFKNLLATGITQLFDEVCFHRGDTDIEDTEEIRQLRERHGIVRPICTTCREAGNLFRLGMRLKLKNQK